MEKPVVGMVVEVEVFVRSEIDESCGRIVGTKVKRGVVESVDPWGGWVRFEDGRGQTIQGIGEHKGTFPVVRVTAI